MNCCDANGDCNQGRDCPVRKEHVNTRKYPRTMNEAFGPYAHQCQVVEPQRPLDWQDRVVVGGCIICIVATVFALMWPVLAP